jgi:hypothetical protein
LEGWDLMNEIAVPVLLVAGAVILLFGLRRRPALEIK